MRNAKIEAIVKAWYDAIHSQPSEKAQYLATRNRLIDEAILGQDITRDQLLDMLHGRYQEYRAERAKERKSTIQPTPPQSR